MSNTTVNPTEVCKECGFDLWLPVGDLQQSTLGLYDDARFPGRCILALHTHYEHLEDVPANLLKRFTEEIRLSVRVIKEVTGTERVNVAILGNRDSHVHAHLIPRYPDDEPLPSNSPWDDPRPRAKMAPIDRDHLIVELRKATSVRGRSRRVRRASKDDVKPQAPVAATPLFEFGPTPILH
jgi:diadenosine tetraphosphate (Ap4A) HIT family hydrolase